MFVCCECCVLSGRGLCDKLITRPEESYRLWRVVVCDLENLKNEEAMTRVGSQHHSKKKKNFIVPCMLFHSLLYCSNSCTSFTALYNAKHFKCFSVRFQCFKV